MTRPKTYSEYANQAPNVTVDIRVRDREITDDMWRVLTAENELSPDIVEQFNMDSDKHTYIDYYDDENVVLTTTTAKESDYKIALFSGIVGERFEMRSLIRDEWNEYYSEVSSVDELFPSIEELNQSRTKENKRIARIGYERPTYQSYSRDAYILAERTRRYIQRRVEGMENVTLAKEHNFKQFRGGGCAIIDYEWKNPTRKETATRTITIDTNKDGIKISHNGEVKFVNTEREIPLKGTYSNEGWTTVDCSVRDGMSDGFDTAQYALDELLNRPLDTTKIIPESCANLHHFRLTDAAPHLADMAPIECEVINAKLSTLPNGDVSFAYVTGGPVVNENWEREWVREHKVKGQPKPRLAIGFRVWYEGDIEQRNSWSLEMCNRLGSAFDAEERVPDAEWTEHLDVMKRNFGQHIASEYAKTIVADLDDTKGLRQ